MPRSLIDFSQLDDFDLTGITNDQILKYNSSTENMEPANEAAEVIIYRRSMMLGGM